MGRDDGLTPEEGQVADHLVAAANEFSGLLTSQHPQELETFMGGIHQCQSMLAMRVARRAWPKGWPIK